MKQKKARCPICKKEAMWDNNPSRPFCSERCRISDLGKWASGDYRITGEKKDIAHAEEDEKNKERE